MGIKSTINNQQVTSNSSKKASSMAELMSRAKAPVVNLSKGNIVEGIITKLTPSEILVDINAKTEAVVLEKDKKILRNLLSNLTLGDKVNVSILNPESDSGNPVVSLRRFIDDLSWEKLKKIQEGQEALEVTVKEATRGGFLVDTDMGFSGFMPNSQVSFSENPENVIGRRIKVFILELNRPEHRIIFSQHQILSSKEFEKLVEHFKIGQKVYAIVATITPFGIFVSLQIKQKDTAVDGLIHISEIAWERTEDIGSMFTIGQKIEAVVLRIDRGTKRVDLSLKRLTKDPFEEIAKKYAVDQKVTGTVSKVLTTGVVVLIAEGVEGFIRKEKIPPTVSYEVGSSINATVSEIDARRHRIVLAPILKEKPIGYR